MPNVPLLTHRFRALGAAGAVLACLVLVDGAQAAPELIVPQVGVKQVLTVGCRFADTAFPSAVTQGDDGVRAIQSETHDFFDQVSNGKLDLQFRYDGWLDLPKSTTDYG